MISIFRPSVRKVGDTSPWYASFKAGLSLSKEEKEFLDKYTMDEFNDDFTTIFYAAVISSREPITIKIACRAMMEIADDNSTTS